MSDKLFGRRKRGKPKPHPLVAPQTTDLDYDADATMMSGSSTSPAPTMTYPRRGKSLRAGKDMKSAKARPKKGLGGY